MDMSKLVDLAKAMTIGMPEADKKAIAKEACTIELSSKFIEFRPRIDAAIAANEKTFGFTHEEATAVVDEVLKEFEEDYQKAKAELVNELGRPLF